MARDKLFNDFHYTPGDITGGHPWQFRQFSFWVYIFEQCCPTLGVSQRSFGAVWSMGLYWVHSKVPQISEQRSCKSKHIIDPPHKWQVGPYVQATSIRAPLLRSFAEAYLLVPCTIKLTMVTEASTSTRHWAAMNMVSTFYQPRY